MPLSDKQLAQLYAPVIRHEISSEAPHKDFILRFDYDRPEDADPEPYWNWRDPIKMRRIELLDSGNPAFEKLEATDTGCVVTDAAGEEHHLDLRAYVYYAVARTSTHDFISYAWYHPADWKGIGAHSNDMEGAMVVAEKDGGPVVIAGAIEHLDINCGCVDERGLPITDGREHENEVYLWYRNPKRVLLHVETKGHGVWLNALARLTEDDWHGTVEYQPHPEAQGGHTPPPFAEDAEGAYRDRDARVKRAYELIPMCSEPAEEFSIWERFKDIRPDGSIGMNPPWLWTHSGDVGLADRGEWFLDPAFYYAYRRGSRGRSWGDLKVRKEVNKGRWSLLYTQNPYLEHKLAADRPFIPQRNARMLSRDIDKKYRRPRGKYFEGG